MIFYYTIMEFFSIKDTKVKPNTTGSDPDHKADMILAQKKKRRLETRDILLIGILLAAGGISKFFITSIFESGFKPNIIIAMYCLAILLVKPRIIEAAIIGILAGAICQVYPGQPYINFASELTGALTMCLLVKIPVEKFTKIPVKPILGTFVSTLVSGFTFIGAMHLVYYAGINILFYPPLRVTSSTLVVLGTAAFNTIIVQVLYIPLKLVLRK